MVYNLRLFEKHVDPACLAFLKFTFIFSADFWMLLNPSTSIQIQCKVNLSDPLQ